MCYIDHGNTEISQTWDFRQLRKRIAKYLRSITNTNDSKFEERVILFEKNGNVINYHKLMTNDELNINTADHVVNDNWEINFMQTPKGYYFG